MAKNEALDLLMLLIMCEAQQVLHPIESAFHYAGVHPYARYDALIINLASVEPT